MANKADTSDAWYIQQIDDNPFISDKAKTTYNYCIKAIKRFCNDQSIHDILSSPATCAPKLTSSNIPLHSQKTYLATVLTFLSKSGLKASDHPLFVQWYTFFDKVHKTIKERENNNIPTPRQELNNVLWHDVLKVRDALPFASLPHLLLSIYTFVPPRRQMDYMAMRIYRNADDIVPLNHNHFHLYSNKYKSPYMFVSDFKNAKYFQTGFFNKEIPSPLVKIIKRSLKDSPRDYLFVQANGQAYTDVNSFQKFTNRTLKQIFNKPGMSVNVLRHSFATYVNSIPNITVGERERTAIKMGHSLKKTMAYALAEKDPPLSMAQNGKHDECYKKNVGTKKLVKIPCPTEPGSS